MLPLLIFCRQSVAGPRIYKFLEEVNKAEAKDLPVGVAGFCWGGLWVTKLCSNEVKAADGSDLITCGFTAHPSMLTYPTDIEKVLLPYAVAASEHDQMMSPENAKQTKEILAAKTAKSKDQGVEHEFVMYEGAHHGFAVRADENETHEAAQGKKAEAQAVAWFKKWFSAA
jgi:dienelactone hydrolase